MNARLEAVRKAMLDGAEEGVRAVVEDLVGRGSLEAPILTGHLRGSGHAEVERRHDAVNGRARFSTPYAAVQHERLDFDHPRGGKAKYLEDPLLAMMPRYKNIIAASAQRRLRELGRG